MNEVLEKYEKIAHPRMPLGYQKQVLADSKYIYNVLFSFENITALSEVNSIFSKIDYYLR